MMLIPMRVSALIAVAAGLGLTSDRLLAQQVIVHHDSHRQWRSAVQSPKTRATPVRQAAYTPQSASQPNYPQGSSFDAASLPPLPNLPSSGQVASGQFSTMQGIGGQSAGQGVPSASAAGQAVGGGGLSRNASLGSELIPPAPGSVSYQSGVQRPGFPPSGDVLPPNAVSNQGYIPPAIDPNPTPRNAPGSGLPVGSSPSNGLRAAEGYADQSQGDYGRSYDANSARQGNVRMASGGNRLPAASQQRPAPTGPAWDPRTVTTGVPFVTPPRAGRYPTSPVNYALLETAAYQRSGGVRAPVRTVANQQLSAPANDARSVAQQANVPPSLPQNQGAAPYTGRLNYPASGFYLTDYQCNVPMPSIPSDGGVPGTYAPPTYTPNLAPNLYSPNNAGYTPLFSLGQESYNVQLGRGIVGQPTVYVPGQPIRNFMRYVFP